VGVGGGVGSGVGVGTGLGVGVGVGVGLGVGDGRNVLGRSVACTTRYVELGDGDGVAACPEPQAIRTADATSAAQRKTRGRTRQA
jgi:hypothetical protein